MVARNWRYGIHLLNPTADPVYIPPKNFKFSLLPIGQKIYNQSEKNVFLEILSKARQLQTIFFVDGNRTSLKLDWLIGNDKLHIIFNVRNCSRPSKMYNFEHSWFSFIESKTKRKNAIDLTIAYQVATLHNLLNNFKHIRFIIVSRSIFIDELKEHVEDRDVSIIKKL